MFANSCSNSQVPDLASLQDMLLLLAVHFHAEEFSAIANIARRILGFEVCVGAAPWGESTSGSQLLLLLVSAPFVYTLSCLDPNFPRRKSRQRACSACTACLWPICTVRARWPSPWSPFARPVASAPDCPAICRSTLSTTYCASAFLSSTISHRSHGSYIRYSALAIGFLLPL